MSLLDILNIDDKFKGKLLDKYIDSIGKRKFNNNYQLNVVSEIKSKKLILVIYEDYGIKSYEQEINFFDLEDFIMKLLYFNVVIYDYDMGEDIIETLDDYYQRR